MANKLERQCIKLTSRVEIIKEALVFNLDTKTLQTFLKQLEEEIEKLPDDVNSLYKVFTKELEMLTIKLLIKKTKERNGITFYKFADLPDRQKEKADLKANISNAVPEVYNFDNL